MAPFLYTLISGRRCLLLLACTGIWACGPDRATLIGQKVSERVEAFRAKKKGECTAALLQRAEHLADSLLLAEAEAALNDSLSRTRPNRPAKPLPLPPIDSLKVQPIFRQETSDF